MNIYIVLIVGCLLRLINLNQSLWLDEATTAKVVSHFSYSQIITTFSPTDFHPPFFYLFMKLWTIFFGTSEIALRFPSVIFSLLAGYVIYLTGRKMKNEKVGLWAAALFSFNPLIMYYSQEARMYMMAVFFLVSALYFYLDLEKKKLQLKNIFLCNVFILLSFISFYGSAFFISTFFFYLLIRKKFKQFFYIHLGFLLPVLLLSPLLIKQFSHARESMKIVANWSQVLGKATLKNLFLIPLKFSIGRISFEPKILYYAITVPWTFLVWFFALYRGSKYRMLIFFLFFPLSLGIVFSVFSPLLQYFRFIFLIPILCLLIALSVKNNLVKYVIVAGFLIFSIVYLCLPQFHREDWKSLSLNLSANKEVYAVPSSIDPLIYYRKNIRIVSLATIGQAQDNKLMVIPYAADIYGIDYRSILAKKKYKLIKEIAYRGLTVEEYAK